MYAHWRNVKKQQVNEYRRGSFGQTGQNNRKTHKNYKQLKDFISKLYFFINNKLKRYLHRNRWSRPISRVLSRTVIRLGRASPRASSSQPGSGTGHTIAPLFGFAPGGVCRPRMLPPARCALTAPFHPYLIRTRRHGHRRCLSVALSVGSRRRGVTSHPALWSPDFPPCTTVTRDTQRLSGRLQPVL